MCRGGYKKEIKRQGVEKKNSLRHSLKDSNEPFKQSLSSVVKVAKIFL